LTIGIEEPCPDGAFSHHNRQAISTCCGEARSRPRLSTGYHRRAMDFLGVSGRPA
jgi:hypothetical protein